MWEKNALPDQSKKTTTDRESLPNTLGCIGNNCDENDQCDSSIAFEGNGGVFGMSTFNWPAITDELPSEYAYPVGHEPLYRLITAHFEVCFNTVFCNMECEQVLGEPHCTQVDWIPSLPFGGMTGTEGALCEPQAP